MAMARNFNGEMSSVDRPHTVPGTTVANFMERVPVAGEAGKPIGAYVIVSLVTDTIG